MATRENSSSVFSSFMNSVERSALSMRVASDITFCNSEPSSSSEVTSETMSRKAISWARFFSMRSTNWLLCKATDACVVMASRRPWSSKVKRPFFLLSIWATPMTSLRTVLTGTQRMLLVVKPVCSSMSRLKRSSW